MAPVSSLDLSKCQRAMEKPMDPRNEPSYDTYDYGTEPIPGDTTWAKQKEDKAKAKCPSCSCQKE